MFGRGLEGVSGEDVLLDAARWIFGLVGFLETADAFGLVGFLD